MRVLVAEDGPVNRELISEMLEVLGCEVTLVEDGQSAVDAVTGSGAFDLILLDNNMPGMSGTEAAQAIRFHETENDMARAGVAVVTGDVLERDLPDLKRHGIDDYLCKPFDLDALESLIDRLVHGVDHGSSSKTSGEPIEDSDEILDPSALDRIRRMQRPNASSIVGRIAGLFLDSAPKQVSTLRLALDERDGTRLQLTAHTLKTGCANLGARAMARIADAIEQESRRGEIDACGPLLDQLEAELSRVVPAIEELIDQETVTG